MSEEQSDLRQQVATLLATTHESPRLFQELNRLTGQPGFGDCADLWAPALYDRDAAFFELWLIRNVPVEATAVIRELLSRAERDRRVELFAGLYVKRLDEASWNDEIRQLAADSASDEALAAALTLRAVPTLHLALEEELALALYQRQPTPTATAAALADFVLDHALPGQDARLNRPRTYEALRRAAWQRGDEQGFWALFRRFATSEDWQREMQALVARPLPVEQIVAALDRRHPENYAMIDTAPLVAVVTAYGRAALPYLEDHIGWLGDATAAQLLPVLANIGADDFYRRLFFRYGDPDTWNQQIAGLITTHPNATDLATALRRWTPPSRRWTQRYWWLNAANAQALYARDPERFFPFLERTLHAPDLTIFIAAEERHDEAMLDVQTRLFFQELTTAIGYRSAAAHSLSERKLNRATRELLVQYGQPIIARFDRLAATDLDQYVAHAAAIMRHGLGLSRLLGNNISPNPAEYLFTQHRAAWLRSPSAIRDLLEEGRDGGREFGLALLEQGGRLAAQRVMENQALLRMLVMLAPLRKMRRRALLCLERAATEDPDNARQLLPAFQAAMEYHAERTIDLRAMVGYVRARHAAAPTT